MTLGLLAGSLSQAARFKMHTVGMWCRVKFWKGFPKFELIYFGIQLSDSEVLRGRERARANCLEQLELKFACRLLGVCTSPHRL